MTDDIKIEHTSTSPASPASAAPASAGGAPSFRGRTSARRVGRGGAGSRAGDRGGSRRGGGGREERARPEFDQKMLNVRRVARVVAGGRRFNFSVLMVIGNRKGSVGVGTGKAGDTALAIEKATKNAKKHMIRVERTSNHSIPHILEAKYSSARIVIRPAPHKGLTAGSAVRSVLELCGISDVNAKVRSGSKNKLNLAQATIKALSEITLKVKSEAQHPRSSESSVGLAKS